ncbi:transporter substrate-binding domain-containing protein [Pseudodesulfovibrio sp. zrk46]|uniref:substrate-binding periplasmic protein n=1 Tax=Pseudodesulfovibrio sp. zrk46 TaxID=2725288 RepID=UPI0014497650|nr:transporter substrate-binding domain-containing protein [Pseudodesulfovibrio sp. zrk46]QJB55792.1 transporter substrate-binding domain-containing protein [Pseudodesulfovibrio sp. zrk46]
MKRLVILMLALVLCVGAVGVSKAAGPDDITYMTEQYPPFNYEEQGELKGLAVDLLDAVLKEMGASKSKKDFKILPWAQGYNRVQSEGNTCLFSMTLTDSRKPLFKWVGPVIETKTAIIAKKGSGVKIGSAADLGNYKYGVIRDDVGQQLLEEAGVSKDKMDITSKNESNIKKLDKGRIDAWAYEESSAKYQLKLAGMNPEDFETVYILKAGTLQFAFNKGVPDALIADFQKALEAVKAKGIQQQIADKYLK